MRYLLLINLKYLAFFLAETDVYKKYDVKLLTEDARVACAAVSRSVSLRRDYNRKTMTPLFGVQTVFKTISKHYKSAVNSF